MSLAFFDYFFRFVQNNVLKVIKGSNIRLKEVFNDYYQLLCYFAYGYVNDKDVSEDIVQDIFIKLFDKNDYFDSFDHLKKYLYKSVKNSSLSYISKTENRNNLLENAQKDDLLWNIDNDFFTGIVRTEVYKEIIDAINDLPTECGRVFKMAYMNNIANSEIAEILDISINTVKVQKNKAKQKLKDKLKGIYPLLLLFFNLMD